LTGDVDSNNSALWTKVIWLLWGLRPDCFKRGRAVCTGLEVVKVGGLFLERGWWCSKRGMGLIDTVGKELGTVVLKLIVGSFDPSRRARLTFGVNIS
jgi:hypothetical protein